LFNFFPGRKKLIGAGLLGVVPEIEFLSGNPRASDGRCLPRPNRLPARVETPNFLFFKRFLVILRRSNRNLNFTYEFCKWTPHI